MVPGYITDQHQQRPGENCQQHNRKTDAAPKPPSLPMTRGVGSETSSVGAGTVFREQQLVLCEGHSNVSPIRAFKL